MFLISAGLLYTRSSSTSGFKGFTVREPIRLENPSDSDDVLEKRRVIIDVEEFLRGMSVKTSDTEDKTGCKCLPI